MKKLFILFVVLAHLQVMGMSKEKWFDAIEKGDVQAVQKYIAAGGDLNARDPRDGEDGETALLRAAFLGNQNLVKTLIDAGADVNFSTPIGKMTALLLVAPLHYPKIIKLLVQARANVNAQEEIVKMTALMKAAEYSDKKSVKILIGCGADLNKQDWHGRTALHLASSYGHNVGKAKPIVALLIQAGADPFLIDEYGKKPSDICFEKESEHSSYKLLIDYEKMLIEKREIHKAAKQPAQLTDREREKFCQFPKGIACEIAGFVVGELTSQGRAELQAEIEAEELLAVPGGPVGSK